MNTTRQDAWTKDEDMMLAETVIRFIREGKTQLEAFKEVAKQLSRTSAACGFRWNATIRKQYDDAIQLAKETRKQGKKNNYLNTFKQGIKKKSDPIDMAILLLKKIRHHNSSDQNEMIKKEDEIAYKELEKENRQLKEQLLRYDEAWQEMGKLWHWVKDYSYK